MKKSVIQIMDITTIKAVLTDLRKDLIPSRFEIAQQPDSKTIQLGFRTLEGLKWLELSWHADAPRIVRIQPPRREGGKSTLAKQIQNSLINLALSEIKQEGFERVINFSLAKRPEAETEKKLILELMGQHSNFLLVDIEGKIITLGKQVREFQSRVRPLSTGDLYSPPPSLKGIQPSLDESFFNWKSRLSLIPISLKKALQDNYQGISPSLALQIIDNKFEIADQYLNQNVQHIKEETWKNIYSNWKHWLKIIENENYFLRFDGPTDYCVWGEQTSATNHGKDIGYSLGLYYKEKIISKEIHSLYKQIQSKIKKAINTETISLEKQINLETNIEKYKEMQEKAIKILSLESPSKDEISKAQNLFQKAKKTKRSKSIILKRVMHHKNRLSSLEDSECLLKSLLSIKLESDEEKLKKVIEIEKEIDEYHFPYKRNKKKNELKSNKKNSSKITEIKSPSGLAIQIGRNHKQNELISLRLAKKGDLWFHAQECPGSHVVLKSSAGLSEDSDIQLAADLAAFFSKAKGNKIVPVIMTSTQNLQRVPGALPGTVRHKDGKVIWGTIERALQHIQQQ